MNSSLQYTLFQLTNPYLKTFDDAMWKDCKFSNVTETRDFTP